MPEPHAAPKLDVFGKMDAVRERLAVRSPLDPAHAAWMRKRLEAVLATLQNADLTYSIIFDADAGEHTPMMVERNAIVEALYGE